VKTISITDTFSLTPQPPRNQASLTSITNAWTQRRVGVPGPLPIIGAGVAFGFSRRLRRRISLLKA
jgi:hypothetical protein